MKHYKHTIGFCLSLYIFASTYASNQTIDNSPVLSEDDLPYRLNIELTNIELPVGNHSGVVAIYKGLWILIAGRKNGLHGFVSVGSFPESQQNTLVYVIDPINQTTYVRDLRESSSGLTSTQIETLSVTSPEFYQISNTLYMIGGYGINNLIGSFDTKDVLTAINLPGVVDWVVNRKGTFAQNITQISDSNFRVSGGRLFKVGDMMNLVFGQNFTGEYTDSSNGNYINQIRRFTFTDNHGKLGVTFYPSAPLIADPNFRRRDLNILPAIFSNGSYLDYGYVAFSGVFTETNGIWTVPVAVRGNGEPSMVSATQPSAFKQGMNVYAAAAISLYSKKTQNMYNIIFGGATYQYYNNGVLSSDSEIPFTNQVITIKMNKDGHFSEHLMSATYPTIPAPTSLGYLLFGASAYFIPNNISHYANYVLNLDAIRKPTVIGYIVGGIESTVTNTTDSLVETSASSYVFKVTLSPI